MSDNAFRDFIDGLSAIDDVGQNKTKTETTAPLAPLPPVASDAVIGPTPVAGPIFQIGALPGTGSTPYPQDLADFTRDVIDRIKAHGVIVPFFKITSSYTSVGVPLPGFFDLASNDESARLLRVGALVAVALGFAPIRRVFFVVRAYFLEGEPPRDVPYNQWNLANDPRALQAVCLAGYEDAEKRFDLDVFQIVQDSGGKITDLTPLIHHQMPYDVLVPNPQSHAGPIQHLYHGYLRAVAERALQGPPLYPF